MGGDAHEWVHCGTVMVNGKNTAKYTIRQSMVDVTYNWVYRVVTIVVIDQVHNSMESKLRFG